MEINKIQPTARLELDIPVRSITESKTSFSQTVAVAAEDGEAIPLERFAAERSVPRELVWSQIQAGRLRARVKNGVVYIMQQVNEDAPIEIESPLEPVATIEPIRSPDHLSSVDLKALLEHLTAAKAEQKELAQLTRTTIEQIRFMSSELVAFKDRLLTEKEAKISQLEDQVAQLEKETRALRRSQEDMETLIDAFESSASDPQ